MFGWLKSKSRLGNVAGRSTVDSKEGNQPGVKSLSDHASLLLEGTSFAMFVDEDPFFQACHNLKQAALKISFKEFWPVGRRGAAQKAIGGGMRLLCAGCLNEMPFLFQTALPGGGWGSMFVLGGDGLPSNLGASAKQALCPWCSSADGIIVWDNASPGEITERDMDALRELWRQRGLLWWAQNNRQEGVCDRCGSESIPRGQGYLQHSDLLCEKCTLGNTGAEGLEHIRKNQDYFGTSELRRARNLFGGKWHFEPPRIIREVKAA